MPICIQLDINGFLTMLGKKYKLSNKLGENSKKIEICKRNAEKLGFRVSIGGAGFDD